MKQIVLEIKGSEPFLLKNFEKAYLDQFEAKFNDLIQFSTQNLMGSSKMAFTFTLGSVSRKLDKLLSVRFFSEHPLDAETKF